MRLLTFILFGLLGACVQAQWLGLNIFDFDSLYSTRDLDSLSGDWQVGASSKTTIEPDEGRILVTDTVAPYSVGGISYAEFSAPLSVFGSAGFLIEISHWMDCDSGDAYGWLEFFDKDGVNDWVKAVNGGTWSGDTSNGYWTGTVTMSGDHSIDTDTAFLFTGRTNGWAIASANFYSWSWILDQGERGGLLDSMRFRLAFQGSSNLNGRDGWAIGLIVTEWLGQLSPGWAEQEQDRIRIFPNPASDRVTVELANAPSSPMSLELFRADGSLVRRQVLHGARTTLDVSKLSNGPYLIRVHDGTTHLLKRVVVQH